MKSPPPSALTATDALTGADAVRLVPVTIEVIEGPSKGHSALLSVGRLTVGSKAGCDLVLADSSVSRRHAVIELLPGAVRVKDLGSRNGIRYLGAKLEEGKVPLGGTVKLGRTVLRFSGPREPGALSERDELLGMLGRSVAMRRLFSVLERVGPQESAVLLRGETGAGKGAAARAVHGLSKRAQRPFVVFDCAAVNRELIDSELFGHAAGAFTGAAGARAGALESAGDGTLFLDEVGELPLGLQPKLLRVLDSGEFRRVGDDRDRVATARILAATHQDLGAEVKAGRFRADLYYRLAVVEVVVPPLRARPEDIPLLAAHFARAATGVDVPLAQETLAALQCDPWPGNVRELRNTVQRVVALGQAEPIEAPPGNPPSYLEARDKMIDRFERDYLIALLARCGDNVSAAARQAKLSRPYLYRLMERHGLGPPKR